MGSYLVQGEAERETERSRPRRTDKERERDKESRGVKRQGQFPTGRGQQFRAQIAQTIVFIASVMLSLWSNEQKCCRQYCD